MSKRKAVRITSKQVETAFADYARSQGYEPEGNGYWFNPKLNRRLSLSIWNTPTAYRVESFGLGGGSSSPSGTCDGREMLAWLHTHTR